MSSAACTEAPPLIQGATVPITPTVSLRSVSALDPIKLADSQGSAIFSVVRWRRLSLTDVAMTCIRAYGCGSRAFGPPESLNLPSARQLRSILMSRTSRRAGAQGRLSRSREHQPKPTAPTLEPRKCPPPCGPPENVNRPNIGAEWNHRRYQGVHSVDKHMIREVGLFGFRAVPKSEIGSGS